MSKKNPFPGVSPQVSQHGTRTWRFRKAGRKTVYFSGVYGSADFRQWYEDCLNSKLSSVRHSNYAVGTFGWLIEQYRGTPKYLNLAASTRKIQFLQQERFREQHGHRMAGDLRAHHVERLMALKKDTPAAANTLLKLIKSLCRYAIKREVIKRDPTFGIDPLVMNPDGFHTWTAAEIQQFEAYHGVGSKAWLMLRLLTYTGGTRADIAAMGWHTIKNNRVQYKRQKTKVNVDLPVMPQLTEALRHAASNTLLFITHGGGRAYNPETLGSWFRKRCRMAGLPLCTSHGVRKYGASLMAEDGKNEIVIASYLGHSNADQARTYTKAADRGKLGDNAMEAFNVANPVIRLANLSHNSLKIKDK